MTLEEDDNKRRRNLVSYSLVIWSTWFLNVEISNGAALIGITYKSAVQPWRSAALAMAVLAYLVWRYATRPDENDGGSKSTAGWRDWRSAGLIAESKFRGSINRSFNKDLQRVWSRAGQPGVESAFAENTDFLTFLQREFATRRGDSGKPVNFAGTISFQQSGNQIWRWRDPIFCKGECQMDFLTQSNDLLEALALDIPIRVPAWRVCFGRFRARLRVQFATPTALDVWLPYYLAVAAAYSIGQRYLSAA